MPNQLNVLAKNCLVLKMSLLMLVCSCLNVSAQSQTINQDVSQVTVDVRTVTLDGNDFNAEELEKLKEIAVKKLKQSKYRSVQTTEKFDSKDSPYNFSNKWITEFVPPNSEHYVRESISPDKKARYENYSNGDKTYVRQEDDSWKMSIASGKSRSVSIGGGGGSGASGPSGSESEIKPQATYELTKGQMVNGRNADLYAITKNLTRKINGGEESSVETDSYWFDKNGAIIKTEYSLIYKNKSFSTSFLIVTNFEYDEKIKITSPEIKK